MLLKVTDQIPMELEEKKTQRNKVEPKKKKNQTVIGIVTGLTVLFIMGEKKKKGVVGKF
jgi:hypothetical protein